MKLKSIFLFCVSMIILVGCGGESNENNAEEGMGTLNSESEDGNDVNNKVVSESNDSSSNDGGLLDLNDTETGWIDYEGKSASNSEYRTTSTIDYDSKRKYVISVGAYIVYFNGDEFLETVQQGSPGPIEKIKEADKIRISYHNSFEDRISLDEQ